MYQEQHEIQRLKWLLRNMVINDPYQKTENTHAHIFRIPWKDLLFINYDQVCPCLADIVSLNHGKIRNYVLNLLLITEI